MSSGRFARWTRDDWLILLARWPELGVGKSRLAASLGPQRAHQLEFAFLMDTLGWAAAASNLFIAFTPATAEAKFRSFVPSAHLRVQPEGDLGCRIQAAFSTAFALGARHAVIVGTDSPNLPAGVLESCREDLEQADVVIAPTLDGGFCALGLKQPPDELFEDVQWSTPLVFAQVVARAQTLGLRLKTARAWYDVDDLTALERLRADLSRDGNDVQRTVAVLRRIDRQ